MDKKYEGTDLQSMNNASNYYKWIFKEFEPFFGNECAEIGAGTGTFSKLLLSSNIKSLKTYEPSFDMYKILKKEIGQNEKATVINAFFDGGDKILDTVFYINVLEHVEDDKRELQKVFESLKTNGRLCLFVPALPFLYSNFDKSIGHFRRYIKKPLESMLKEIGFKIEKSKYFDFLGIIPWYFVFVLGKCIMQESNVTLYDKLVVPIEKKLKVFFLPSLAKIF